MSKSETIAIDMRGLVKGFGEVLALDHANFRVHTAAIHGLVGQNGAGKSTLIKVLAGLYRPDQGEIVVRGRSFSSLTPRLSESLGIQFIHQDRLLVPSFTVGEAIFLGREIPVHSALPLLSRNRMERRARDFIRSTFGIDLPAGALIQDLTTAQKQVVQIARALLSNPSVLVFDEPTAALSQREANTLFRIIRDLRERGITIIYISHYLSEIEGLCDSVTIMRNGRDVSTVDPRTTGADRIAQLMIDRDLGELFPARGGEQGELLLETEGLSLDGHFEDVNMTVRSGEIVGLTGLIGSGSKEFIETLFGLRRASRGKVSFRGEDSTKASPAAAVQRKVAFLPEDRRGSGVALSLNVAENITLASLPRFASFGLLDGRREHAAASGLAGTLAIKTPGLASPVRSLSGGNQQKVVLAKWLCSQADLFIMDEPTVGVDIGAKAEIYVLLQQLVEQGAGILLLSSDLPELIGLSDRLTVMHRGRIVAALPSQTLTPETVLGLAAGQRMTS